MCALFDDLFGWVGFASNGTVRPWSGFTAQVDVSQLRHLLKHVGSVSRTSCMGVCSFVPTEHCSFRKKSAEYTGMQRQEYIHRMI